MKKFLTVVVGCMMLLALPLCGCNKKQNPKTEYLGPTRVGNYVGTQDFEAVYGLGAVTTAELAKSSSSLVTVNAQPNTQGLPSTGDEGTLAAKAEIEEFNRYYNMMDGFFSSEATKTTVENNDSTDPALSAYAYKLTVVGKNYQGNTLSHTMYYNETELNGRPTFDPYDHDEVTTYKGYQLDGVIVMDGQNYYLSGYRSSKTEVERDETEHSHELWIMASLVKGDRANCVVMEQEVETESERGSQESETSFVYKVYKNSVLQEYTEISFEEEGAESEYEFEFFSAAGASRGSYEIEKVTIGGVTYIEVEYRINGRVGKFRVEENGDNYIYHFTSNPNDDVTLPRY